MIWRKRYGLLCLFLLIGTTYGRKLLEVNPPSESNDEKVSSSISHILRSLAAPPETSSKVQIITKHGVIEANRHGKGGRKLFFGEDLPSPHAAQSGVPAPVVVSSQTISIKNPADSNKTGGNKRGRSLSSTTIVDPEGVRTIEGVRVPDDEHDKFHTWRNARVIKNFLVENGRPANPHRKRQIVIQDARSYLGQQATGGVYAQNFGPTQATLIDVSSYAQPRYQTAQPMYYTATAVPQTSAGQFLQGQDLTSALYAAAAQPQQVQQQQQVYQYQTVANSPTTLSLASSAQDVAYAYSQAQQQQQQQGQQMYVLQPDGKTYLPYDASTGQMMQSATADQSRTQTSQSQTSQNQPSQFQARSSESAEKYSVESPHPQLQQHVQRLQEQQRQQEQQQQEQQQQKMRQEQAYQQHILSKHKSHLQQEAQGKESVQSKSSPSVNINSHSGHTSATPATPQPGHINPNQLTRKSTSQEDLQHLAQIAATALPTGASIRQQLQQQVSAHILQPQASEQHHQVYRPLPQHSIVQDSRPSINAHPVQGQFVIQPQTYSAGGGQMFSVPVPIPVNQIAHGSRHEEEEEHTEQQQNPKRKTLTNRVMESLHLNVNRRTAERFETSAVVPVLSSAGILFGLGAIAAGWYLSKSNREVGIVKKTGKFGGAATSGTNGGKDNAVIAHLRKKRAPYDEVDQASFFQSIIQHGIEKQQERYDPPETNQYNKQPSSTFSASPLPAAVRQDRVSIKPLSYSRVSASGNGPQHKHSSHDIADKSGKGINRVKNFANVFIPAVVLGGSVIVIGALIFGWYVSGTNREIAFLEPSAYSRRKRSLSLSSATTSLSDGWLHRILTSMHSNPYETEDAPSNDVIVVPHPIDSGKSTITESDITNLTVAMSLAAFAFGAMTVLGLAWYFTDNSRQVAWADNGPYSFGHWPTAYHGPRVRRSIDTTNDMNFDPLPENQGFLHTILSNLQVSQSSLLNKLHESGYYSKWQETPCAQRIFCDVMSTQGDDTVRLMEKRMIHFLSMLPDTTSSSLSKTLGDVMTSIYKKDCSAFTCGGHWVDSTAIPQPSSQQPR